VFGTADEAEQSLYGPDLSGPMAWVLGSEDKGLRRLVREHCDELVSIPMLGSVQSLNVSVAAGVVLYETVRQRQPAVEAGAGAGSGADAGSAARAGSGAAAGSGAEAGSGAAAGAD
jgi:tRNA C32,U32 (ribose-2'-O)-methylase TrmJ